MARLEDRVPEDVPGDWFVDRSCIDCDTCRQIAPDVFADAGAWSYVRRQPDTEAAEVRAAMALVACPTSSIGTLRKDAVRGAADRFPEPIAERVSYCGFTAASSYGASSYFVQRDPGAPLGNLLVDSPRAARPLLKRLAALGGVGTMLLTHRDDVADHDVFHRELGCDRVLHRDDAGAATAGVERLLTGGDPVALADDLVAIPVPGHTRGSVAYLYQETFLFTGDHLWLSEERERLHASRSVCWYSWREQTRSMEKLLDFRFEWVLPGHGRRFRARSAAAMRSAIEALVREMRAAA